MENLSGHECHECGTTGKCAIETAGRYFSDCERDLDNAVEDFHALGAGWTDELVLEAAIRSGSSGEAIEFAVYTAFMTGWAMREGGFPYPIREASVELALAVFFKTMVEQAQSSQSPDDSHN